MHGMRAATYVAGQQKVKTRLETTLGYLLPLGAWT